MKASRSIRTTLIAIVPVLIACGSPRPAAADVAFDPCAGDCGILSSGDRVDPSQLDADDVAVTETLAPSVDFVDGSVGNAARFNAPAEATLNSVANGFAQGTRKDIGNPAGTFGYAITCPACDGESGPQAAPLSSAVFSAAGISTGQSNAAPAGYYISSEAMNANRKIGALLVNAADIMCPAACGDLKVPEPTSIGLFGAALIGLGAVRRRYKAGAS